MKTRYLFPYRFKKFGWILFLIGIITYLLMMFLPDDTDISLSTKVFALIYDSFSEENQYFLWITNDVMDEFVFITIIIGGLLTGFSRVKHEDEYTYMLRTESLVWSFYVNFGLLLFLTIFTYGMIYLSIITFNLFSCLLFFIIRFHYLLYKSKKTLKNEE
ncbi:hypothetical protein SAMN04487906_0901 [Zhouia amylolytica]|uniref:Uncharacterized protein n=1 Tax=Zhouia amylolytica TaxID=376730 RepID=A0A1I6QV75_9FLAO|nr:hypothetical protein [Zhouia amylolytica]SFS56345.1 hypothetical protein SAMN04487906_0901 [Zhouia amylolytica]